MRTLRFCMDGRALDRRCADDERCQNNTCVFVPPGDAGAAECVPGCAGGTTVRRCVNGEAMDTACLPDTRCVGGNCVVEVPADGGMSSGGMSSGGACEPACVDEKTARACTTTGQAVVVACASNAPCTDTQCKAPPAPTPVPDEDSCTCAGSTTGGMWVAALLLLARARRKRV